MGIMLDSLLGNEESTAAEEKREAITENKIKKVKAKEG